MSRVRVEKPVRSWETVTASQRVRLSWSGVAFWWGWTAAALLWASSAVWRRMAPRALARSMGTVTWSPAVAAVRRLVAIQPRVSRDPLHSGRDVCVFKGVQQLPHLGGQRR